MNPGPTPTEATAHQILAARLRFRASGIDGPMPETLREAKAFEYSAKIGLCVQELAYRNHIAMLRGIDLEPPGVRLMRVASVLSVEEILAALMAARLPLAGHSAVPDINFLLGPRGVRWIACDGVVLRADNGKEIRLAKRVTEQISRDNVWKIMADLDAAYSPLQMALGKDRRRDSKAQAGDMRELLSALKIVKRKMRKAFPCANEEIVALELLVCEQIRVLDSGLRALKAPPKDGLQSIMPKLKAAFQLLFGRPATGRGNPEDSPFMRFAVAFLRGRGSPYAISTLQDAIYRTHRPNRRRKAQKAN